MKGDEHQAIVLDFTRVPFVDVSAARAVETIGCDARHAGKHVFMSGMNDQVRAMLSGLNADHCLPKDTHYETRLEAIRAAVAYVEDDATGSMPALDSDDKAKPAAASV